MKKVLPIVVLFLLLPTAIAIEKPVVVSRTEWECPDGNESPGWTQQYANVTHILIHHTATPNTDTDWPARVRSIWNYHTYDRGWGDVGYNYLIDPNGIIYEGRAGGDDVIAGHVSGHNTGTMGVAFLGTFSDVEPTDAALDSVELLIAWKSSQKGIEPLESSTDYAGSYYANIAGHRDLAATECPGEDLYGLLPTIRQNVYEIIQGCPAGDADCDGSVSDFELLSYIDTWASGEATDFELLAAIESWANG